MRKLLISTGTSRKATKCKLEKLTWRESVDKYHSKSRDTGEKYNEYLSWDAERQSNTKDVGWHVTGEFKGNNRKGENLLSRSCITLDIDHADMQTVEVIKARLSAYDFCLLSTHKHSTQLPRLRLVAPLSRDILAIEYEPITRRLAERIGIEYFDHTTYQHSRIMFHGSHSSDMEPLFYENKGRHIDPIKVLSSYSNWKDRGEWAYAKNETVVTHKGDGRAQNPTDKIGPIGNFCRAWGIIEAMDEFLPGVYEESGTNRFSYVGGSTVNGAIVYDDIFLYSYHESDPTAGILCNAYDLVRIHKYGHLSEAKQTLAMMDLIKADPASKAEERNAVISAFKATGGAVIQLDDHRQKKEEVAEQPAPAAEAAEKPEEEAEDPAEDAEEREAAQQKKDRKLIKRFLKRFVYVAEGDQVCDLKMPASRCMRKLVEWNHKVASSEIWVRNGNRPPKPMPMSIIWLKHKQRRSAEYMVYDPSKKKRLIKDDHGVSAINTFHLPGWEETEDIAQIGMFINHLRYLLPIEEELSWFADWMAFTLQYPHLRSKITPLHVSRKQGTGRGWVVELMFELLGSWNCKKTKIESMMGGLNRSVYHDAFADSLFCNVDEVKQGGNRFAVNDHIKDLLEAPYLEINVKYGKQSTQRIYTNIFMQSNHTDALILEERDRRINVLTGPTDPRSAEYYVKLYDWLANNKEGVRQVYWWLMRRDLTKFRSTVRAMDTIGMQNMIANAQTATERVFHEWLEDNPPAYATQSQITNILMSKAEQGEDIEQKQVKKLVEKFCSRVEKQVSKNHKRFRVWKVLPGNMNSIHVIKRCVEELEQKLGFEDV